MKYPKKQFKELSLVINKLNKYVDVKKLNPHNLHYIVYQQFSGGQKHNRLIIDSKGNLTKQYKLVGNDLVKQEGKLFISYSYDFKLYPDGCNDNHIETAIKNALKTV